MWSIAVANLRSNPVRFISTVLAVMVATTFLAGVLVLRDSVARTVEVTTETGLADVAVAVIPPTADLLGGTQSGQAGDYGQRDGVPTDLLGPVRGVDGVAAADGTLTSRINLLDDAGQPVVKDLVGTRRLVDALNPFTAVDGRLPERAGELAIDRETAERRDLAVGRRLTVATAVGPRDGTIVGLTTYLDRDRSSATGDVLVSDADATDWLGGGRDTYDTILVTATPGTTEADLAGRVETVVGAEATALTGSAYRDQVAGQGVFVASLLGTGLQVFAYVALFVGAFIIYNTFTITVAQRLREFALLRAIGATGRQVRRVVRFEAVAIGLGASALGMVAGTLLFLAASRLIPAIAQLAGGGTLQITVAPTAVVQVLLSGLIITYLSATLPAWRAARARPVEAMTLAAIDRSGASRVRAAIGLVALGLGVTALLVGAARSSGPLLALGPLLLIVGALVGGPVLAAGFSRLVGLPFDPHRHPVPALATANAARNPNRTATTANALVVGVALVVFVTAAGGAVRDYLVTQLASLGTVDALVVTTAGQLPEDLVDDIRALPSAEGVAEVASVAGVAQLMGAAMPVEAADPAEVFDVRNQAPVRGSFADLGDDGITMPDLYLQNTTIQIGDPIEVTFLNGEKRTFRLAATTQFSLDALAPVISLDAAREANPTLGPDTLQIRAAPGQVENLIHSLEDLTLPYATVGVAPGSIFSTVLRDLFNALISSVNALLGVAVLIALFGIVNTLVLSITERTHEIGILRAVGMSRRQLAAAVRIEAVVVAVLGTLLGMAFGLFTGWCLTRPLFNDPSQSIPGAEVATFSWPLAQLGVIALLGIVIGVVASLLPAWRATRLDVLDAIRTE